LFRLRIPLLVETVASMGAIFKYNGIIISDMLNGLYQIPSGGGGGLIVGLST
jgi:hypothetical protein